MGYLFDFKLLYGWNLYTEMSLLSAIGNSFLGLGLWALWRKKENEAVIPLLGNEEKQVISLSFTILFCTIFLSGFALFNVLFPTIHLSHPPAEAKSAVLIAMVVGMSILLWQLVPLIRQLIHSEKKLLKANILLKESEDRFRSAFDNAAIGMALIFPEGHFLKVNKALCEILGYSENELLNTALYEITHADDLQENKISIHNMLEGRSSILSKNAALFAQKRRNSLGFFKYVGCT